MLHLLGIHNTIIEKRIFTVSTTVLEYEKNSLGPLFSFQVVRYLYCNAGLVNSGWSLKAMRLSPLANSLAQTLIESVLNRKFNLAQAQYSVHHVKLFLSWRMQRRNRKRAQRIVSIWTTWKHYEEKFYVAEEPPLIASTWHRVTRAVTVHSFKCDINGQR